MATVTVIPARNNNNGIFTPVRKKRVAAYARVSTDTEEQLNSYTAQCKHYTELITSNPDYEFVGIYTDEGITGTCLKRREGFNRMVNDALNGEIDLIYVKSISRLGRNIVDNLNSVRALRSRGVDMYIETMNIHVMDLSSEMLIAIFSSIAQEESRSISENVAWGIHRMYKQGDFSLPYKSFLGYEKGADGKPKIVEKEAVIIRRIYKLFLIGYTPSNIATLLTQESIPTPTGKEKWAVSTVKSILQNEKYCGCALLQKGYVPNFLDHKCVRNNGELEQFFIENSHDAIIPRETFEIVQGEFEKRQKMTGAPHKSVFSGRIYCGDCNGLYGTKVWHSTDKYRKVIFQCNNKFHNKVRCKTPNLTEDDLKGYFTEAVKSIVSEEETAEIRETILDTFREDPTMLDNLITLQADAENLTQQLELLVNSSSNTNQTKVFKKRYELLCKDLEGKHKKISVLENEIKDRRFKYISISNYYKDLDAAKDEMTEFDDELWYSLCDKAVVHENFIMFVFKDGSEVEIKI